MHRYDNYKDSGVEWIGEIPQHWEIKKYKYFSSNGMGQTILGEDLISSGIPVYSATQEDKIFGYVPYSKLKLKRNDLVIPARGNSIGFIYLVKEDLATCTQTTIYSRLKNIYPKFIYYCSVGFKEIWFEYDKTAIPQITVSQINNNLVPIPSIQEQTQIANYLDTKCNQIDTLVLKKEELIEKLKKSRETLIYETVTKGLDKNVPMKDSGIEWIGEIPEHWVFCNIRYLLKILTDFTSNGSFADLAKNVTYLDTPDYSRLVRLTDLRTNLENDGIYVSKKSHEYLSKSELFGGELLMANVGAYSGLVCLLPRINFKATLGPNMFLLKFNEHKIINQYVYLLLGSSYYNNLLTNKAISSAQPKLNKEDVKSIKIMFPPTIEEQKRIILFLNERVSKIDILISKTQEQIEVLKKAKQSLIFEVVTGKRKVI